MDDLQQQQIREWAAALGERDDPERRAVGRAMLLMLDEIAMLRGRLAQVVEAERRELDQRPTEPLAPPPAEAEDDQQTAPLRLRDRIRHVAERHPHDDA